MNLLEPKPPDRFRRVFSISAVGFSSNVPSSQAINRFLAQFNDPSLLTQPVFIPSCQIHAHFCSDDLRSTTNLCSKMQNCYLSHRSPCLNFQGFRINPMNHKFLNAPISNCDSNSNRGTTATLLGSICILTAQICKTMKDRTSGVRSSAVSTLDSAKKLIKHGFRAFACEWHIFWRRRPQAERNKRVFHSYIQGSLLSFCPTSLPTSFAPPPTEFSEFHHQLVLSYCHHGLTYDYCPLDPFTETMIMQYSYWNAYCNSYADLMWLSMLAKLWFMFVRLHMPPFVFGYLFVWTFINMCPSLSLSIDLRIWLIALPITKDD